jgi:hypothetical protein
MKERKRKREKGKEGKKVRGVPSTIDNMNGIENKTSDEEE